MASIDEAYLDMTGTERLHGRPLAAAHRLHDEVKTATKLNNSIGAASSRLVAKIASDQAQTQRRFCGLFLGRRRGFSVRSMCAKSPASAKVTERHLHECGIRKVRDLASLDDAFFGRAIREMGARARGQGARRRRGRLVR